MFLGELNRAPEFVGEPDREVVVGQEYIYTTRAVDPDGDELRYSVLVCPSGLTVEQDTGEVRWSTPVVGNYTVTLAVEDGHGGRDIQTYTLQVVENVPNRPPLITSTPVTEVKLLTVDSGKIIVAHDEWPLTDFGFGNAPEDANQFVENVTDFFSSGEKGKFLGYSNNFSITGTRLAEAFSQAGHSWTVSTSVPFNLETLLQYNGVFLAGFAADNEVLIDYVNRGGNVYLAAGTATLGSSQREAETWATFLSAFGLAYEWPFNRVVGILPIDATPHPIFDEVERLYQNNGNSILDLDSNNDSSLIIARGTGGQGLYAVYDAGFAVKGENYSYDVQATDPDGDTLTYGLEVYPEGMWIEPDSGVIRWAPNFKQIGTHDVTVVVEDGRGGKTTQIFDVLVLPEEGNNAPIIISEPVLTAIGGETYNYDVKAVDPDGDTLTYSLIKAPQEVTIDSDTGKITWFPSGEDLGEHRVTVQVEDGRGGVDQQTYILSVPGEEFIFTNDEDWLVGVLTNVNYTDSSNQLQLAQDINTPFNHIWVALSGRDTVVRIDTDHQEPDGRVTLADSQAGVGAVLGEYYSRPAGRGGNPSRTTVDQNGDVWVGNRNEASGGMGSVTKLSAHPTGMTSTGIWNGRNFDVLSWSNVGGVDNNGGTSTATDSAVELYVRTAGTNNRTIAIDAHNDVWVGGYSNKQHVLLDGETGAVLKRPIVFNPGGYGGLVDGNGVLWSASNVYSLARYDPATEILTHIPTPGRSYGLAVDTLGNIWNTHSHHNTISKIDPAGNIIFTKSTHGAGVDRGVAITPRDNHVWVANSGGRDVSRLDNDGNLVAIITVESVPTGVSVDSNGKVWVTNRNSNSVSRIDPATNQVDLTIELGSGAYPYNYSDMTGTTVTTVTNPQGTWRVIEDSGTVNQEWGWIFWNTETEGAIPPGAGIKVEARAANDLSTLNLADWKVYESGEALDLIGQFIEVRATLTKGRGEEGKTPVLSDLRFTTKGIAAVPNANPIITSTAPVRVSE